MNLEIALSLARKGKKVIVSSRRGAVRGIMELGDDNSSPQQQRLSVLLSDFMRSGQVRIHFGKAISEITGTGAVLRDQKTKEIMEIECDNVLMCRGYHGQPAIFGDLQGKVPEIHLVGDAAIKLRCDDKRVIGNAITDAWGIANSI